MSAYISDDLSPPKLILSGAEPPGFSSQQRSALIEIDLDFRAKAVQLLAERELLRIATRRSREDLATLTIDELRAIEGKTLELKIAWLDAAARATSILLPEQRSSLTEQLREPPCFEGNRILNEPEDLDSRIVEAVGKRLKDAKVVEIETTQAIADRLLGWAKSFGLVVGTLITLLGIILAGLGIKGYTDLRALLDNAKGEVTREIDAARKVVSEQAAEMQNESRAARAEVSKQSQEMKSDISNAHTSVSSLVSDTQKRLEEASVKALGEMQSRLESVADAEVKFQTRLAGFDRKFASFDDRLSNVDTKVDTLQSAFDRITSRTLSGQGKSIADAQKRLQELGMYKGPINNTLDQPTKDALIEFQRKVRIPPDGSLGLQTYSKLFGDLRELRNDAGSQEDK